MRWKNIQEDSGVVIREGFGGLWVSAGAEGNWTEEGKQGGETERKNMLMRPSRAMRRVRAVVKP